MRPLTSKNLVSLLECLRQSDALTRLGKLAMKVPMLRQVITHAEASPAHPPTIIQGGQVTKALLTQALATLAPMDQQTPPHQTPTYTLLHDYYWEGIKRVALIRTLFISQTQYDRVKAKAIRELTVAVNAVCVDRLSVAPPSPAIPLLAKATVPQSTPSLPPRVVWGPRC
jgi:hypothetical protein